MRQLHQAHEEQSTRFKSTAMSLCLVQCASGRFVEIQSKTADHHLKYCKKFSYNYRLHYGRMTALYGPMWDKVFLCHEALQTNEMVVWLDSDCLIVDMETHLEKAFDEFQNIGCCRHNVAGWKEDWHFNCGAIYMRRSQLTLDYLSRVLDRGIVPHPHWRVQATMLQVNDDMKVIQQIDDKWNSTVETNMSPNPVVESWHGHNASFQPILERLSSLSA